MDVSWASIGLVVFGGPMEFRGYILKPAPNPKYFGYPNPQNRGRKSKPKPETQKPETRGYPPQTRSTAILMRELFISTQQSV